MRWLGRIPFEALFWFISLVFLAVVDTGSNNLTFCPLSNAGWTFCPGCGFGKSISLLFQGQLLQSLKTHPLGVFGVVILCSRIVELTRKSFQHDGKGY